MWQMACDSRTLQPMTRRLALGAMVLILAIGAFFLLRKPSDAPVQPGGPVGRQAPPPSVEAMRVVAESFRESVTVPGTVQAEQSVELRSEVGGRVTEIRFVEGASVRTGQLLVKLADDDLRARKKKLEQQLALESNRKQRLERLRAVDGASLDDYEAAAAQVAMRSAEIDEVNAALAKTEIRAPFAGVVGLRQVSVGAVIAPSTLIVTLTNVNELNIDCSVPERYTASLRVGSVLTFRVRGIDSVLRTARIHAFEPMVDMRTRTQRLRARIDDTRTLNAGAFADVIIALNEQPEAVLLPSQAVVQDQSGATVYRVEGGIARMVPVTLGGRTATHVHVLTGITPGDTVVVSGILFVKNGQPVKARVR